MKIELDLLNYAKKKKKRADLKNAAEVDKSKITRRVNLANLKSDVE